MSSPAQNFLRVQQAAGRLTPQQASPRRVSAASPPRLHRDGIVSTSPISSRYSIVSASRNTAE